jgi:hypothetical protein
LVTFSGEAEKVTARRAGAQQREAATLRRNYKHRTLRRSSTVTPKLKQNRAAKQTVGRQIATPTSDKNPSGNRDNGTMRASSPTNAKPRKKCPPARKNALRVAATKNPITDCFFCKPVV